MSEHSSNSKGSSLSDSDQMALFWIVPIVATVALGSVGLWWSTTVTWLVDHSILTASGTSPIVQLPAAHGAGLDDRRLIIAIALIVAVLAIAASVGKAASSARQAGRLQRGDRG